MCCLVCEEMLHKKRAYQLATENNTTAQDEKFRSLKFNFCVLKLFFFFLRVAAVNGARSYLSFGILRRDEMPNKFCSPYIHKFFHIVFYLSFIFLERLTMCHNRATQLKTFFVSQS